MHRWALRFEPASALSRKNSLDWPRGVQGELTKFSLDSSTDWQRNLSANRPVKSTLKQIKKAFFCG
jgi:hypothetical protein